MTSDTVLASAGNSGLKYISALASKAMRRFFPDGRLRLKAPHHGPEKR